MKKLIYILSFIIGVLIVIVSVSAKSINQENAFYYAFDKKIYLIPNENKMLVKYTKKMDKNRENKALLNSHQNLKIKWRTDSIAEITLPTSLDKNKFKNNLDIRSDVAFCHQFYSFESGLEVGMLDEILVQFLPNIGDNMQKELNKKFGTHVVEDYEIFQILRVPKDMDVLDVANRYFETGFVKFSKPNFLSNFVSFQTIPNDTYFNRQIACHNIGQIFTDGHSGTPDADIDAPEAWDITTGSNDVIVAIIDEGVTSNHPDLPNSRQVRLPGSDFVDGDGDPSPTGNNNHGNACAGIIGATMNNNQGIAGIAPSCKIMPVRIDYISSTVADFALAIRFAANNGAKVISNSWGLDDTDPFTDPPYSPNLYPEVVTAIEYATNYKKCVVLFAASNSADHVAGNNGYIAFPANVTIPYVITVGASDRNDRQANYSPTSNPNHSNNQIIDIVAPSNRSMPWQTIAGETYEMWSIDIPGNAGYNPWSGPLTPPAIGEINPDFGDNNLDYTARFGGTSHSCPVVAGVVALMLSVNPSLTPQQVFNILTSTANQVGGYTYTNGRCNEMGYGRVNAHHAVIGAIQALIISGPSLICDQATYTINNFPDGATVQWSVDNSILQIMRQDSVLVCKNNHYQNQYQAVISAELTIAGSEISLSKDVVVGNPQLGVNDYSVFSTGFLAGSGTNSDPFILPESIGIQILNVSFAESPHVKEITDFTGPSGWTLRRTDDVSFRADFKRLQKNNTYLIDISYLGECGIGRHALFFYCKEDDIPFIIFPNPAVSQVTITMSDEVGEKLSTFGITTKDSPFTIQLWSSFGLIKQVQTDQPGYQLDLTGVAPGFYYVHVIKGGQTYRKQLVVQ